MSDNNWADLIVVSRNARKYLKACLERIKQNSDYPCRVWVVDNASTDATRDMARFFPWVRWVWNKINRGYGQACNQGAALGQGRYIVFLNCDVEPMPGWLSPLVQAIERDERIALVGPKLLSPEGLILGAGVIGTNSRPVVRGWLSTDDPARFDYPMECLSLCGACLMVKRRIFSVIGAFDPAYFHYFEETDLCFKARSLGYRILFAPESRVVHHLSASCRDPRFLREQFLKSRSYFRAKWKEFLNDGRVYEEKPYSGPDCGK